MCIYSDVLIGQTDRLTVDQIRKCDRQAGTWKIFRETDGRRYRRKTVKIESISEYCQDTIQKQLKTKQD